MNKIRQGSVSNSTYSNIFYVAANGNVGIGGNTNPAAQLDIFLYGTNAGFNITGNGTGSIFNVANDGSLTVGGNALISGNLTVPSIINTTSAYNTVLVDNSTGKLVSGAAVASTNFTSWALGGNGTNASSVASSIGTTDNNDLPIVTNNTERLRIDASGNVLINTATSNNSTYKKMLTVNGDVSFANYASSGSHQNDGGSGLEILGNNGIPTARGISVEPDPNGDFNFYINAYQSPVNPAEFNFKNVIDPSTSAPAIDAAHAPTLMKLDFTGALTLPTLSVTTTGYRNVLIDNFGKITPGGSVGGGTLGSAWVLGGNSNTGDNNILGTTDGANLIFSSGGIAGVGTPRMVIKSSTGFVGIGDQFVGTSPDSVAALLDLGINSIHGSATPTPFAIRDFHLSTTAHSWNNTLLEVNNIGHIYMGTTRPSSTSTYSVALLTVSGTIVAKEIFVATTDAGWADYVFKKDYKLMPLKEVEKYISTNQHLPNVPSAAEVETKGQNLGALQIKQMEKTEELYLYIIEMNKKLEKLEEQNKKLANEVTNLKKNKQ